MKSATDSSDFVDSDYTMFDALHTQTAMSANSLHIIKQM